MRGDFFDTQAVSFGFYAASRHCISRLSPRNSNRNEVTANNGAAANRSGCHGSCYSTSGSFSFEPPFSLARMPSVRATLAATAPASAVAELESLGAFAHLFRAMSASEDILSPMPPSKLHGLKTSGSELVPSSSGLAFGSFESIEQSTFPGFAIRESRASSTASFFGVHRELHASRRSTRSVSTRLDRAAVLGCSPLHAPREFQLSRGSRSGVPRESRRCSRNSFMTSVPNRTAPNHALQRTAPRVTVAAISSLDPSSPSHLWP